MAAPRPFPTGQSTSPHSFLKGTPGLQGAQATGVEITVYALSDDAITQRTTPLRDKYRTLTFNGTSELSDTPSVVSCTVNNAIGSGGTFAVTVKAGLYGPLLGNLSDDSWIDITFTGNGKKWHVMRGLVDEVRVSQGIGGSGAYVTSFSIVGRSFQKVFANTPYYFNMNAGENLNGRVFTQLLNATAAATPRKLMELFLRDIPAFIGKNYGRGNWTMPRQMPNAGAVSPKGEDPTFSDVFSFNFAEQDSYNLPRVVMAGSLMMTVGTGDMWSIAQNHSDSMYSELFTEQMTFLDPTNAAGGNPIVDYDGTQGLDNTQTSMTVVYRDKPFITVDESLGASKTGKNSPYFRLTEFVVKRQDIQSSDLGVSGYERYNAFFSTAPISIDGMGNTRFYQLPLWFPADIKEHGLRRMDITSIYSPLVGKSSDPLDDSPTTEQWATRRRAMVRDWYCLGASMLSGTLSLGCGAPHLKVGCRLRVPAANANDVETNFYIEGLTHTWSAPMGTRTNVTVTRGWIGSNDHLLATVRQVAANYEQGKITVPVTPPINGAGKATGGINVG